MLCKSYDDWKTRAPELVETRYRHHIESPFGHTDPIEKESFDYAEEALQAAREAAKTYAEENGLAYRPYENGGMAIRGVGVEGLPVFVTQDDDDHVDEVLDWRCYSKEADQDYRNFDDLEGFEF